MNKKNKKQSEFRKWLIRKLGGYLIEDLNKYTVYETKESKVIEVHTLSHIDHREVEIYKNNEENYDMRAIEFMCQKIYEQKLFSKLYERNLEMDGFDLQYTIKVVEPIALGTAAVEVTRDADGVGNALKTILMRIRGYEIENEKRNNGSEYLWRY